jgi:GxxExxY protein
LSEQMPIVIAPALTDDLLEDEIIYWIDFLVQDWVVIEFKDVAWFNPIFEAQVLAYLRMIGKKTGLPISFDSRPAKDGIRRFIL